MEPIAKRTRRRTREKEERENQRSWADLDRDVLIIIYHKVGIKDLIVGGAPLCCRSWYKASKETCLWRQIDLNAFSSSASSSSIKNEVQSRKLIEFVVDRSGGSITSIDFSLMADEDDLLYVAERCPQLKHFSLRSRTKQMDEEKIFLAIGKLSQLESMAVDEHVNCGVKIAFEEDINWGDILTIFKPGLNFLYPDCECKLTAFDDELYRFKILELFKYLIFLNRTLKVTIRGLEGRIHDFEGSGNPYNEDSLRQLEGEICELKGHINARCERLVCEVKGLTRELEGLSILAMRGHK